MNLNPAQTTSTTMNIFNGMIAVAASPQVLAMTGLAHPQHPTPFPWIMTNDERMGIVSTRFLQSVGVDMAALQFQPMGDRFDMMEALQERIDPVSHPLHTRHLTIADIPWTDDRSDRYAVAPLDLLSPYNLRLLAYSYKQDDKKHYPLALLWDPQGEEIGKENSGSLLLATLASQHHERRGGRSDGDRFYMRITHPWEDADRRFPAFPTVYQAGTIHGKALVDQALPELAARHRQDSTMKTLVMGTGAGLEVAYFGAQLGIPTDAVDFNAIAVANTLTTAAYLGIDPSLVRAWRSDLFDSVPDAYDAIIFDAPHVVSYEEGKNSDLNIHDEGGELLRRTLGEVGDHLAPGGALFLMSDPRLPVKLPRGLKDELIYRPPAHERRWENFGIHRISVKQSWFSRKRLGST